MIRVQYGYDLFFCSSTKSYDARKTPEEWKKLIEKSQPASH